MQVTSTSPQKKRGRYNLNIDGEFWCGVSERVIAKYNLYKGKAVDKSLLEDVFRDEICYRLYDRCVRKLANRPHSIKEIERYLTDVLWKKGKSWFSGTPYEQSYKKFKPALIQETVDKLGKEKMLDDEVFASWWVDQRTRNGRKGWYLIQSELKEKGVDLEIIRNVEVSDDVERDAARKAFEKYCVRRGISKEKCIQRLKSRGFSWDSIRELVDELDE